jgi:glycosyltransferase involved in cell wall biosynthesis
MPEVVTASTQDDSIRISVVIPTLNEARNIVHVLAAMPADVDEIILVDGHSVDGTVEAALGVRRDLVVVRQSRRGKGNALAAGIAAARGAYVVLLDADGSMDPAEVHDFVAALDAGADYVKGTRFRSPGGSDDLTIVRRAGNAALNGLTNLLFGTEFTDLCYGYNAFRRRCQGLLGLPDPHEPRPGPVWGDGFEVETLINIRAAKAGLVIQEVPSYEHPRRHGESNLNAVRDGMRVLRTIVRERCRQDGPGGGSAQRRPVTSVRAEEECGVLGGASSRPGLQELADGSASAQVA